MAQTNWSAIFAKFPELEAPGYQETMQKIIKQQPDYELERLKAKMQSINKEKQSERSKNRSKTAAKKSVTQDSIDPLFGVNKRRGKKR